MARRGRICGLLSAVFIAVCIQACILKFLYQPGAVTRCVKSSRQGTQAPLSSLLSEPECSPPEPLGTTFGGLVGDPLLLLLPASYAVSWVCAQGKSFLLELLFLCMSVWRSEDSAHGLSSGEWKYGYFEWSNFLRKLEDSALQNQQDDSLLVMVKATVGLGKWEGL